MRADESLVERFRRLAEQQSGWMTRGEERAILAYLAEKVRQDGLLEGWDREWAEIQEMRKRQEALVEELVERMDGE